MTPYRENHLMLDVSQSDSEAELRGNRKIAAPYRGAVVRLILIPISASHGL